MRARSFIASVIGLCVSGLASAQTPVPPQPLPFEELAANCAPDIHPATLKAVVCAESSWNPYAIGVVGGRLERQPRSLAEAVATARELEGQGFNFSMGLGQVNRHNLAKHGETYETVFEPCRNLKAGGAILKECFVRAKRKMDDEQSALRAAFSCYYSGNFTRGFRADKAGQPSYVQKVVAKANTQVRPVPLVPAIELQSSDGAQALPASGRTVRPARQAVRASQWVVFADNPQQLEPSAAHAEAEPAKESAAKVHVHMPSSHPNRSAGLERPQPSQQAQTVSVQPVGPSSSSQDAPFVQFVH